MLDYARKDITYKFNLDGLINIFYLNNKNVINYLTSHGGALSTILQLVIISTFKNYKEQNNNSKYDFLDVKRNIKCELKTITNSGLKLTPSSMTGAKRSYTTKDIQ